jgi:hypothetical protein
VEMPAESPIAAVFCARICAVGKVIDRTAVSAATLFTLSLACVRRKRTQCPLTAETKPTPLAFYPIPESVSRGASRRHICNLGPQNLQKI